MNDFEITLAIEEEVTLKETFMADEVVLIQMPSGNIHACRRLQRGKPKRYDLPFRRHLTFTVKNHRKVKMYTGYAFVPDRESGVLETNHLSFTHLPTEPVVGYGKRGVHIDWSKGIAE